jgi:hypothetical protein
MIKLAELLKEEIFPFKEHDITYDEMEDEDTILAADYIFTTPDNRYKVSFYSGEYEPEDKTFDVSFGLDKGDRNKLDTFELTGEGRIYSILQTVCKIIEEFVKDYRDQVEKLNIEGTSEERSRIYKVLIPKYLDPAIMQMVTIE